MLFRSPEGSSQHRLTTWNTPSASPISTREKPRRASSSTQMLPAGRNPTDHSKASRARFCRAREKDFLFFGIKTAPSFLSSNQKEKDRRAPNLTGTYLKKGALIPSAALSQPRKCRIRLFCSQRISAPSFDKIWPVYHKNRRLSRKSRFLEKSEKIIKIFNSANFLQDFKRRGRNP